MKDIVQQMVANLNQEVTDEEACYICFTPPDEDDDYRLELCGHLTCKSCLKLQVQLAQIPLTCPKEVPKLQTSVMG